MTENFIGKHQRKHIPPNLIYMVFHGDINRDDGKQMSEWFSEITHGIDARYLVDLRELGNIPPEARKELAAERRPPQTDKNVTVDLAFIGATLRTKVLMTVVVAAAAITSNVKVRTHYFADVDAALAWAQVDKSVLG